MRGRLLLFACVTLLALGCGGEQAVPVSGKVTLNGAPLPNAKVIFQPVAKSGTETGPPSEGTTNAQGEYTLQLVGRGTPGAVVGSHRVSISALQGAAPDPKDDNPKPRKELVPERYNANTELKFDVPAGGTSKADFPLSAADRRGS